jgi:hypothetical protein
MASLARRGSGVDGGAEPTSMKAVTLPTCEQGVAAHGANVIVRPARAARHIAITREEAGHRPIAGASVRTCDDHGRHHDLSDCVECVLRQCPEQKGTVIH